MTRALVLILALVAQELAALLCLGVGLPASPAACGPAPVTAPENACPSAAPGQCCQSRPVPARPATPERAPTPCQPCAPAQCPLCHKAPAAQVAAIAQAPRARLAYHSGQRTRDGDTPRPVTACGSSIRPRAPPHVEARVRLALHCVWTI